MSRDRRTAEGRVASVSPVSRGPLIPPPRPLAPPQTQPAEGGGGLVIRHGVDAVDAAVFSADAFRRVFGQMSMSQ